MAIKSRTEIKIHFETGDIPTESQFWDLIDSYFHKEDDSLSLFEYNSNKRLGIGISTPGSRLGLLAEGTGKHLLSFHDNIADLYGSWLMSMNQGGTPGFSINEGSHLSSMNRFFIKPSDGYVGIGTNTPSEKLDVSGAIKLGGSSSEGAAVGTIRFNTSTGDLEGRVSGTSGPEWKSLTTGSGGGGTSSQWTTTGSDIYYSTGNVGVGIIATETLDVNGGIRIRNNGTPAAVAGTIKFDGTDLLAYIGGSWKSLTGQSQWTGNTGSNLYISTGNVGIGVTSSISERLEIAGAIKIGDSANADSAEGTIIYESGTFKGKTLGGWEVLVNSVDSVNGQTGGVTLTTTSINEGSNLYFNNTRAISAPLTGYVSGSGTIIETDSILEAVQKLNGNIVGLTTSSIAEGSKLFYTNTRTIAAPLTGYSATTGTISASDTVLTAFNKLSGNTNAKIGGSIPATAGLIPYSDGNLNSIQTNANLTYQSNALGGYASIGTVLVGTFAASQSFVQGLYPKLTIYSKDSGSKIDLLNTGELVLTGTISNEGQSYFGSNNTPTAYVDIEAGNADTASIRIRPGVAPDDNLLDGSIWYDGTNLNLLNGTVTKVLSSGGTIKGSVAATTGLIPYGTGTADTLTSSSLFSFDPTILSSTVSRVTISGSYQGQLLLSGASTFLNILASNSDAYVTMTGGATNHIIIRPGGSETARFTPSGNFGVGNVTAPSALIDINASTTARAALRLRSGVAPTTANDGDIWYDGTNLKAKLNGTTTQLNNVETSLTNTQIGFGGSNNLITGSTNFTWNNTGAQLTLRDANGSNPTIISSIAANLAVSQPLLFTHTSNGQIHYLSSVTNYNQSVIIQASGNLSSAYITLFTVDGNPAPGGGGEGKIDFATNGYGAGVTAARIKGTKAYFGGATNPSAVVDIAASQGTAASLRLQAGSAPSGTIPAGSVWFDGTNIIAQTSDLSVLTAWQNASGGINYPSGNIGIGTNSPSQKLHIAKDTALGLTGISIQNTASGINEAWLVGHVRTDNVSINDKGVFSITEILSNHTTAERFSIQAGGNVGIGVGTPTEKLEINGAITIGVASGEAAVEGTIRYDGTIFQGKTESGWVEFGGGSNIATTDDITEGTTNFYFTEAKVRATLLTGFTNQSGTVGASDSVLSAFQKLENTKLGGSNISWNNTSGILTLKDGSGANASTLQSNATNLVLSKPLAFSTTGNSIHSLSSMDYGNYTALLGSSTTPSAYITLLTLESIGSTGGIVLGTNSVTQTTAAFIKGTKSYFGGLTNPEAIVEISPSQGDAPSLRLQPGSTPTGTIPDGSVWYDGSNILATIGANTSVLSAWNNVSGGINYSSGNVGIGASSPGAKLHLAASANNATIGLKIENTIASLPTNWLIGHSARSTDKGRLAFTESISGTPTEHFSILTGGKVGIGINNPTEKLEVNGGIKIGDAIATSDGTLRYNGSDIQGRVGGSWKSLTGANIVSSQWSGTTGSEISYVSSGVKVASLKLNPDVVLNTRTHTPSGGGSAYNVFQITLNNINTGNEEIKLYKEDALTAEDNSDFGPIAGVDPALATILDNMRLRIYQLETRLQNFGLL